MYRLQMEAGWSDFDLRAFLTITYRKTHWNLLDKSERAGLISILKSVIEANEPDNGTTTDTSTKLSVTGTHTEGTEGHGKVSSGGAQDSTDTTGSVCYNQESDKDIPF